VISAAGRWAIAHCAKLYRVPAAWECRLYCAGHVSQQPGFKWVDYAIWGHAGASLPRQEVWHRWSAEGGDRSHSASLITASDNGNVVCGVSWMRACAVRTLQHQDTSASRHRHRCRSSRTLRHYNLEPKCPGAEVSRERACEDSSQFNLTVHH